MAKAVNDDFLSRAGSNRSGRSSGHAVGNIAMTSHDVTVGGPARTGPVRGQ